MNSFGGCAMDEALKTRALATRVRASALRMVTATRSSHIGGALSIADVLAVLYGRVMAVRPDEPSWDGRDRLFYSKGHACTAVYSVLAACGFFPESRLQEFVKDGSPFTSHVSHHVPGVEWSTGSLGHAFPVACGVALAGARREKSHRVFCILSDGELDEGSNWESFLFAAHHKLHRLTVIVDFNKIQSFGTVAEVMALEPLAAKLAAFNWDVVEVDGHDHGALASALAPVPPGRPRAVIAHTVKGKGVAEMEGRLEWHYRSPSAELLAKSLEELGAAP